MATANDPNRATPKEIREFFSTPGKQVSLQEIKALKDSRDGKDYDQIANGLGNGSLTY